MTSGGRVGLILLVAGLLGGCGSDAGAAGDDVARPAAGAPSAGLEQQDGSGTGDGVEPGEGTAPEVPGSAGGTDSPQGPAANPTSTGSTTAVVRPDPGTPASASAGNASGADADESPASSEQGASTEEILRATSRAYEGLRSFRAEFEQTLRNSLLGRTARSEGTLYQRQPDRFLMAFSDPPDDLIVSDGDYFWMYFPSVDRKQVLRTPRGSQGLDLHAQFIGDPVRRFDATYHGMETVEGRPAHVMTLVPRERMGYTRLKVWIDQADHLVRRFELTETNENVRHFLLRDLVRNPTLPDSLFAFDPPPGTQVVDR